MTYRRSSALMPDAVLRIFSATDVNLLRFLDKSATSIVFAQGI